MTCQQAHKHIGIFFHWFIKIPILSNKQEQECVYASFYQIFHFELHLLHSRIVTKLFTMNFLLTGFYWLLIRLDGNGGIYNSQRLSDSLCIMDFQHSRLKCTKALI